jgi:RNA-binding protein 8A
LIDLFQEYGPLKNLHLNLDRRTGYVKVDGFTNEGYALVEYREYSEAKEAIKNLDNFVLHDKKLSCDFAFVRGPAAQQNKK